MPILIMPDSGDALTEYNKCHSPEDGKFCSTEGGRAGSASPSTAGSQGTSYARPKVLQVKDINEAIRLIQKGKTVELPDTRSVNTLLEKLAKIAKDAKEKGEDAPNYDLCKVTVKGTNLFCHDRVRTAEHPEGIPRIAMPQFSGEPVPGSTADKLPKDEKGGVNAADAFIEHLKSLGIGTQRTVEQAARLKATQAELIGTKVAGMMTKKKFDPRKGTIFVSRDHYVIDGHHRWAAAVGLDAEDNALGDIEMNVIRVDAPISEILHISNKWTKKFGIAPKAAKAA